LLLAAEFSRIFRDGRRRVDRFFAVIAAPRTDGDGSRLGLAISRKALPRAVDRNRIKRLVRDSFRHTEFSTDVDVVVVARAGLRGASRRAVRDSLVAHFANLGSSASGDRQTRR
jgi:ribonuclease P protein component